MQCHAGDRCRGLYGTVYGLVQGTGHRSNLGFHLSPACIPLAILGEALDLQVVSNLFVNETYVLYQCGTTPPTLDVVPAGAKFFEIPLTSISVIETVPYAYLVSLAHTS